MCLFVWRCNRRVLGSSRATLTALLGRINAEVVRLAALASGEGHGAGAEEEREAKASHAHVCIPLWLRAYRALSAVCLPDDLPIARP